MSLKEDVFDLTGKVALVTGAGLGLGRSFALTLASAGADLAIADINREGLDETGEMLKKIGGGVLDIAADVSNPVDVGRMVKAAVAGFGRLDVAVNNAGIVHKPYRFHETPLAEWDRLMSINLTGVFLCMQQEIAAMLKAQQGIVINISSILGVSGLAPAFMPKVSYIAAKHAVNGLTKQAALEYAGEGIRVNGIAPGWFEGTGLARERLADKGENFYRQRTQRILDATPMGRRGRVQELNGLLLYLASEASSFVTGQTFVVDGGWTC